MLSCIEDIFHKMQYWSGGGEPQVHTTKNIYIYLLLSKMLSLELFSFMFENSPKLSVHLLKINK